MNGIIGGMLMFELITATALFRCVKCAVTAAAIIW
jgi:hypothetical protein